ncbi:MAG: Mannosyltransferase [Parcubacteria group bacterium GW2011_GWA2_37_10]|nr:MAG: Mannosyltransferase [Parcubacteria group bacterium GW2011_GWA2_37_10]
MKIAIFHNYMDNIGGAELVDLIMARELGADIYTTNINKEKIKKMGFRTDNIFSIGKIPVNAPFKQEGAYWKFKNLNLGKKYDFYIIAGDWAMSGAAHNKPNLWYVYSPIRELYDLNKYIRENIVPSVYLKNLNKYIFDFWVFYMRFLNKRDLKHVEEIVCISENVKQRVKKYLRRDSEIIYPPTETNNYYYNKNGKSWLSVNRLIGHKRVDMQLKAFSKIPNEKLIIVGSYENSKHFEAYSDYCHKIKPENVEIKSWISQSELIDLYANCKGFLTTAIDEDFGMTPVEAMASGKPVIAPNEGGYKETIINGKTGILIDDINEDKLAEAVKKLGKEIKKNPLKYKKACQEQAKKFDTKIFIEKIKKRL